MDNTSGWTTSSVGGHTCDVYSPSELNPHGYVVIALHDKCGGGCRSVVFQREYECRGLPVIAPRTGHSWWSDCVVPAFDEDLSAESFVVRRVVEWIQSEFGSAPPQIALLGAGMGGQGALRMSYKHPNTFPVVAAIAPDLDYQYRILDGDEVLYAMYGDVEAARQDTAILHIHPLNWPRHQLFCCDPHDWELFQGVDRLKMKLGSIGVPYECDVQTAAEGNYADTMAAKVMAFVMERLDRERLRVV